MKQSQNDRYTSERTTSHHRTAESDRLSAYLLATNHPAGRAKAVFFVRFGFTILAWQQLRDALFIHARSAPVASVSDTPFGRKYILEGPLASPDGRNPRLRSVWFIAAGEVVPGLATAYPLPGGDE
jgi:hypothetical protein